jgi:hypothetical protein
VHIGSPKLLALVLLCYLVTVIFFSPWFFALRCRENRPSGLIGAFLLSLETLFTVGWGMRDPLFKACPEGSLLVLIESVTGAILDSCLLGILFARAARGMRRATTIIFSDKALLHKTTDGRLFLLFRAVEMRKHQLCDIKVKMYCVSENPLDPSKAVQV